MVLLAGSGVTAHIYDDLAPKLTEMGHVYGITRRGFGGSDRPASGYDDGRFEGYAAFQRRALGIAFPESELRQLFAAESDGRRKRYLGSADAGRQMGEGTIKHDYARIGVPILALFAGEPPTRAPGNALEREAINTYATAKEAFTNRWKAQIHEAKRPVQIVDLPDASHYVFLSNATDVLRELQTFVKGL
jgi:pimeloyl-ACP methyl ester carboxylesterase